MTPTPQLSLLLGGTLIVYILGLYVLCLRIQSRIQSTEDFLVAGRRLPLPLASATLLATWFGAGTILASADEIRHEGLRAGALEPIGPGFCLIIVGMFFARPLWRMQLLTLSDFFRRAFDTRTEVLSALVMVPSYFGWVAAQFVALAGILNLFFNFPMGWGIVLVAMVAMGYTLLGGMWSVTLTDAFQIGVVLVGLIWLAFTVFMQIGDGNAALGAETLWQRTPGPMRVVIPHETIGQLTDWLAVFVVGALGNVPGQDVMQRVFAARTASIARKACFWAGGLYLLFGIIPMFLGLASRVLFPENLEQAVLPALAQSFLSPVPAVIFTVVLVSAVLSTTDSAILSPASVLAQNVLQKVNQSFLAGLDPLLLNRIAIVVVTLASVVFAFAGESAYSLLEDAYEIPLVCLFVPLTMGLYSRRRAPRAAIAAVLSGLVLWSIHYVANWTYFLEPMLATVQISVPSSLAITAVGAVMYLLFALGVPANEARLA